MDYLRRNNLKDLNRLIKYTLRYYWSVVISLLAMIVQVIGGFYIPKYMKVLLDEALLNFDKDLLIETGLIMVGISLISLLAGVINTFTSQRVATSATMDLRNDLFTKIQSLSTRKIDKFKTSRLVTTATNDVLRVQQFFQMMLRIIVRAPLMFGIGLYMAYTTSKELSSIFLVSLPLLVITIVIIVIIAFPLFSKVQKSIDGLNKASLETANSPRVIKSFVRMDHENSKFNEANEKFRLINTAAEKVMVIAEPAIMLIFNVTTAGIILLATYFVQNGSLVQIIDGVTVPLVGVVTAFYNYMMQILFGLMMFAMVMIFVSRALASAKRIVEVLDEEIDLSNCNECINDFDLLGSIEFKNVNFSYEEDGNNVLNDISFKIKAGERVGIIGSTGSGKTSIINLIPRLYDVSGGEVLIDNMNVKQLEIKRLREQISVVTQRATLFSGSIGTNLLQGNPNATIEDLEEATKSAQAYEFVKEYDDLYNHEIQQKGTNLSGGQKQRLSLARAFARKPKIMILDDSTSAVDAKSEEQILHEIKKLTTSMTTVIISQKISTIKDMDKILVLNNHGSIDGYDTHENLMRNSKVYQEIALSQIGVGGALNGEK